MKKRNKLILLIIAIIIILLIPIKVTLDDGGTIVYNSLTYKVIIWHEEDITYESGFKTGKEVHIFPNNFKTVKYYSELASGERERNFGVIRIIDNNEKCTTEEKELFYKNETYEYYFECPKSTNITVVFNDKTTMLLPDALAKKLMKPEELSYHGIRYQKVDISIEDGKKEESIEDTEAIEEEIEEFEETIE